MSQAFQGSSPHIAHTLLLILISFVRISNPPCPCTANNLQYHTQIIRDVFAMVPRASGGYRPRSDPLLVASYTDGHVPLNTVNIELWDCRCFSCITCIPSTSRHFATRRAGLPGSPGWRFNSIKILLKNRLKSVQADFQEDFQEDFNAIESPPWHPMEVRYTAYLAQQSVTSVVRHQTSSQLNVQVQLSLTFGPFPLPSVVVEGVTPDVDLAEEVHHHYLAKFLDKFREMIIFGLCQGGLIGTYYNSMYFCKWDEIRSHLPLRLVTRIHPRLCPGASTSPYRPRASEAPYGRTLR